MKNVSQNVHFTGSYRLAKWPESICLDVRISRSTDECDSEPGINLEWRWNGDAPALVTHLMSYVPDRGG